MPNRLAGESSPYLRQHANNPVDWYPWGPKAMEKARAEDKPILLSIGYSACHWCHVMERECFENEAIARQMNEGFVNVKVDREERPDLDQVYQNVSQLMTRSGGWPLTVFLTPHLEPFFGGTYFPPEDRHGRPGFPRVLEALSHAYRNDRAAVAENARKLTEAMRGIEAGPPPGQKLPDTAALKKIADGLLSAIDWRNGGFGGAPKFPNASNLAFLWRFGRATQFGMAEEAAVTSLARMASGGIYDQLGGGFHRYSVDERWAVPHFEKMLYDNAALLKLCSEVLLTADGLKREERGLLTHAVTETVGYVLREMHSPEGGFYSTQDADSEGEEGRYFVWSPAELAQALSEEEARVFELRYGVTERGNFEGGRTVLWLALPVGEVARKAGLSDSRVEELLASARAKLFEARTKRVKPGRDEKILASWNGLMISGLCWAWRALLTPAYRDTDECAPQKRESLLTQVSTAEAPPPAEVHSGTTSTTTGHGSPPVAEVAARAREAAREAMRFARSRFSRDHDRLWGVYKDGQARFEAYLDDYAFLSMAALDLARCTSDPAEIEDLTAQARRWAETADRLFSDCERGGYFFTSEEHEKLPSRPKTLFDQAVPSGSAILLECLLALGALTGEARFAAAAEKHFSKLFNTLESHPHGMGELACASLLYVSGPITVSATAACIHPHVFQKPTQPNAPSGLVVCHRETCLPLAPTQAGARALVLERLSLK